MELTQSQYDNLRSYTKSLPIERRKAFIKKYTTLDDEKKGIVMQRLFGEERVEASQRSLWEKTKGFGRRAITPLASPEYIKSAQGVVPEALRFTAETLPFGRMGVAEVPPFLWQAIPPHLRRGAAQQTVSEQTSPAAIAGNLAILGGAYRPKIMGRNYSMARAERGVFELDKMRTVLGQTKTNAIAKVRNKVVENFKPTFSEDILNKLRNPIYGIKFNKHKAINPTIGNLDRVLDALGDFMTGRGWVEATKKTQQSIRQSYGYVANAMRKTAPEIKESITAYSQFMKKYNLVNKTLRDTGGNIMEKKLRSAFEPGAERGKQIAWEKLSQQSPEINQIMKDMKKFVGRQQMKRFLAKGLGGSLAYYLLHRLIAQKAGID